MVFKIRFDIQVLWIISMFPEQTVLTSQGFTVPFRVSGWGVHICVNSPEQVPGAEGKKHLQTYAHGNFHLPEENPANFGDGPD